MEPTVPLPCSLHFLPQIPSRHTVSVFAVQSHCSPHCSQQKSSVAILKHSNHMYVCDTSGSRSGEDLCKTKRYRGAEVELHSFLISTLNSVTPRFLEQEAGCVPEPVMIFWIRENLLLLPDIELRFLGHKAGGLLYRLLTTMTIKDQSFYYVTWRRGDWRIGRQVSYEHPTSISVAVQMETDTDEYAGPLLDNMLVNK